MAENSAIEWTDHTFNSWIGCTKVSPGCANCYAEQRSRRFPEQGQWGPGALRKRTSEANWRKPLSWNRQLAELAAGGHNVPRERVFCASLADWLDPEVDAEDLADLLALIAKTPNLDWLLLTKRPHLWAERMEAAIGVSEGEDARLWWVCSWLGACESGIPKPPPNVWIGTSVEDQQRADERIPHLLEIPARVRFLSCEPLLGPVDLTAGKIADADWCDPGEDSIPGIHWVIAGGESGPSARPMHPAWARSLRDQCQAAGVAFFFKQWGAWQPICAMEDSGEPYYRSLRKAKPHENQATVDELCGRRCTVENGILHNDGELLQPGDDGAFLQGREAMHVFRVGKKAAGRELDGRTWDEVPS